MNKTSVITVLVVIVVMVLGIFAFKTYDTSDVTYTNCVVTETKTDYRSAKRGGTDYVIKTENCGKFDSTKSAMKSVEEGKTYDLTATGSFTWMKTVSVVTAK